MPPYTAGSNCPIRERRSPVNLYLIQPLKFDYHQHHEQIPPCPFFNDFVYFSRVLGRSLEEHSVFKGMGILAVLTVVTEETTLAQAQLEFMWGHVLLRKRNMATTR